MKTIIISGHDGFIGSALTTKLKEFKIIGISNRNKSTKNTISLKKNICNIKDGDITKSFQTLIHLAAISDVKYCNTNPKTCYNVNVIGTNNLLEIARKNDADFIFASSSHIYGNPKQLPIKENDHTEPLSIYSSSKIMAETMCKTYSEVYGLNISILRLFSVYGPNAAPHNIINSIIHQMKSNSQISLGNTKSKRDFVYIDDVANAFYKVAKSQKKGFHTYNISTNKSTSIKAICKKLIQQKKSKTLIISDKKKLRKNDASEIRGSFLKFKKHHNWIPKMELDDGLKITFDKQNNK